MFQKIKNYLWHLPKNFILNIWYGFPSKKLILIGVTGTDGKTTTCHLIHRILINNGFKAGLISTIGAQINENEYSTTLHMTSPDPKIIQKLLKKMMDEKVTHVVLEVTAHALDQFRYLGCNFKVSAITNTSHEHFDYFSGSKEYINVKKKLFTISQNIILNKDDSSYNQIKKDLLSPIFTYSIKTKSNYQAKNIKLENSLLKFKVNKYSIVTDSNYYYQIYNILAALAVIEKLDINPEILINTVKNFPETKGRREEINNDFEFKTIVDFAHTPAALENTLSSLKKITSGNLITIFGATGGRDKSKRPLMGKTVSEIANIAIITADDTRNEKIEDINNQIISGINYKNSELIDYKQINTPAKYLKISKLAKNKFVYFNVPNRQDAFNLAIKLAQPKDTIIACGKGHETTILHGNTEYPWSEPEAFRTALRLKNQN